MNILDFIFRMGVLFAIYGFIWGLIDIGIWVLGSGRKRTINEVYFIKIVKYILLVDVTFLYCVEKGGSAPVINQVVFAGIILLTYFIGKLQKSQNRSVLFKVAGQGLPQRQQTFNMKAETTVIAISLAIFALLWFFPEYARNPLSTWFSESITAIAKTPVIGFIFKVIGFFFLLSLIFKMLNTFTFLLNGGSIGPRGGRSNRGNNNNDQQQSSEEYFDDYEEVE